MESTVWRLQGIDTGGADLILSRIVPWSVGGAVPVLSIDSSSVPTSGALENLLADDDSVCVFAAADVRKPGFYIEFTLPEPAVPWGFRFAGPSADNWPLRHQIVVGGQACSLNMLQWVDGGLTGEPTAPLLFGQEYGEWVQKTDVGVRDWYSCAVSANGLVLLAAAYSRGYLYLSIDGGATWLPQVSAGARDWYRCAMSADGQVLLAGVNGGYLYLSIDGGKTWAEQTAVGNANWRGCAVSSDGQVLLSAPNGAYLHVSTDGGVTWSPKPELGSRYWSSCAVSADGRVLLAGISGGNLHLSIDGGATWTQLPAAGSLAWYACAVSADGEVMLAGVYGSYLTLSTDGGATWEQQTSTGIGRWRDCALSDDGQVMLAAADEKPLYFSSDGGEVWGHLSVGSSRPWYSCAMSADGQVMMAGTYVGHLYLSVLHPPIYLAPPTRQSHIAPELVHSNQTSLRPQGLNAVSVLTPTAYDTEHSGPGTIHGTVEQKLAGDTTLPLKRRVRLHRSRDGLLVRETWSDENGNYRFDGLSARYEYDVIAWDHEGQFRSTIANNLKPEVLP